MKSMSRIAGTVAVAAFVLATVVLQAHTKLEKSEPAAGAALKAAPKQVQLWFNEKIDPKVTKIVLTGAAGEIKLEPAHPMGDKSLMTAISGKMADGAYTIGWQTAGDDGHVVKGDVKFTVKTAK